MDREVIKKRMYPQDEHDSEFVNYVDDLLRLDYLDDPIVEGIARQIIGRGVDSLTNKQINTFIEVGLIKKDNYLNECAQCSNEIPWCEMLIALEDGCCSYCSHGLAKLEKE